MNELSDRIARLSPQQRARLERELLERAAATPPDLIPRRTGPGPWPLSYAQERLWLVTQLHPERALYNEPYALRLRGPLDVDALERALRALVDRHEILRTVFRPVDGEPRQEPAASWSVELRVVDLRRRPATARAADERSVLEEAARRPFDLTRDLPFRSLLIRLGDEEHVLLMLTHHIASDGWSTQVALRELEALYGVFLSGRAPELPELPIQYADFAVWERQTLASRLPALLGYWTSQLAGAPVTVSLPTDRARPPRPSHAGARETWRWDAPLVEALTALGRQQGATLYMVLMAAVQTLLHRYTGQEDVVVGSPIAGRYRRETEALIGFFANTIVVRTDLSKDPTFRDLLRRVRAVARGAYAHQEAPFERVVESLHPARQLGSTPFANVMLTLQNVPNQPWALPGLSATRVEVDNGTAKFDLTVFFTERDGGLRTVVEYATDLFDAATVARLGRHLETLLTGIVADPDRPLSRLPLLEAAERRQLVEGWNATAREYPRAASIPRLFEAQVRRTPDSVAVAFGARRLTYRALDRATNRLAWALRRSGVGPDVPVGLAVDRSADMVVGALGILKAGGAYVPLDPTYPAERLRYMVDDAGARVVVGPAAAGQAWGPGVTVLGMSPASAGPDSEGDMPPPGEIHAEQLAYVMYTSGSTGHPKGVMIPHRAVLRLVCNTDYITLTPADVVAQASNVAFDAATFEIWGALLHGARLVGLATEVLLSPPALAAALRREGVTALFLTTALFNQVAAEAPGAFGPVRTVLFGGEAVEPRWVAEVLGHTPPARLLHVYGPTETTTFASWWPVDRVPAGAATVPIGRPLANTELHVLDRHREPVPIGVTGELYIGGDGLARGYLNQPELTAERFVTDPFRGDGSHRLYRTGDLVRRRPDGAIEFVGRVDDQVKIRGFRVELGEIEHTLRQHAGVRDVVAVLREDAGRDRRLVAYWSPDPAARPEPDALRAHLRARLPAYMVPSALLELAALPLTPNGKVDRRALPALGPGRGDAGRVFATPRDRLELQLARIWERVLAVRPIGRQDNFFELGGHSLLAFRLVTDVNRRFERQLPLYTLYQAPTVAALAEILRCEGWAPPPSLLLPYRPGGSRTPLFAAHALESLGRELPDEQPYYALHPHALDGRPSPETVEAMAAAYIEDIRAVQAQGPYRLAGASIGGLVVFEMAQQLRHHGESVDVLILLDPSQAGVPVSPDRLVRIRRITRRALDRVAEAWRKTGRRVPRRLRLARFLEVSLGAASRYQPKPYPGRVLLLVAAEGRTDVQREFWRGIVTGPLEIQAIPGDHFSMFRPPHLAVLARHVRAALAAP